MASERSLGLSVPVAEVLSAPKWRTRYAHGVLLGAIRREWRTVNRGGDPVRELTRVVDALPDDTIRHHLAVALSEVEVKLGIPMGVTICKSPPLDDGVIQGVHFDRLLERRPMTERRDIGFRIPAPPGLVSIERIRAYFYGNKLWEVSESAGNFADLQISWANQGTVTISPTALTTIVVSGDALHTTLLHRVYSMQVAFPDFWAIDCTLAPSDRQSGIVGHIPLVLAHYIACAASIPLLSLASMAVSQGVTSSSVSLDGVSRSISLQASAMYGMNSALENVYKEALQRINWKELSLALRGIRVRGYSA